MVAHCMFPYMPLFSMAQRRHVYLSHTFMLYAGSRSWKPGIKGFLAITSTSLIRG